MQKVSVPVANHFCPQSLFLFGVYREDGAPNFGLFCWVSYCNDGELSLMACIGEDKLTRDRIRATGRFSANLVSRELLPLADAFGCTSGRQVDKSGFTHRVTRGAVLDVPVLEDSPWVYELEVKRTLSLDDNGELYICRIRNVLAAETLVDESLDVTQRLRYADPVVTTHMTYFGLDGTTLGSWGEPGQKLQEKDEEA